jgi:hypothetical protein
MGAAEIENTEVTPAASPVSPSGGVRLSPERLARLGSAWESTFRQLRAMDSLDLGETEPAVTYGRRAEL